MGGNFSQVDAPKTYFEQFIVDSFGALNKRLGGIENKRIFTTKECVSLLNTSPFATPIKL